MRNELHRRAESGDLERVQQLVEGGANIDESDQNSMTALILASLRGHFEIVVYLIEHGANIAHADGDGRTALHWAGLVGSLSSVKCSLGHGARIADRDHYGMTAFLYAADKGHLEVVQYLLSSEGGASITEANDEGSTALLLAAGSGSHQGPRTVQWLLEYGGAAITDTNKQGSSVWSDSGDIHILRETYEFQEGVKYVTTANTMARTAMLRVMVLHGGPPETLTTKLPPPFQRIVQDGARLRARLPAYLAQRRALLDAHCPLLPPLRALVHGYEEPTTTDELWATGLGAPLQRARRSRPERGESPERRSVRLRRKCG
jgi:hypothetical protein